MVLVIRRFKVEYNVKYQASQSETQPLLPRSPNPPSLNPHKRFSLWKFGFRKGLRLRLELEDGEGGERRGLESI